MSTIPTAAAIICEYNPPHRGHAYHIQTARAQSGAEVLICIMSELMTQRGELAVTDPYHRAQAAVAMGADLVLSLPFPWSGASAEFFAAAGVHIATALGAQFLHFGSECGNIDALLTLRDRLRAPDFTVRLTALQQQHPDWGIMEAREQFLRADHTSAALPTGANDHLAVEYLLAIAAQNSPLIPLTTRRVGQDYLDQSLPTEEEFASASALRTLWRQQGSLLALSSQLPQPSMDALLAAVAAGDAPTDADRLLPALLAMLRLADPSTLGECAELGGGVAQRLIRAARESAPESIEALVQAASTRRYTNARLRRALLFGMCNVRPAQLRELPAYTRLLALNRRGAAYLSAVRKSCALPVVTKVADLPSNPRADAQARTEASLASLYALSLPVAREAGYLLRRRPVLLP